MSERAVHVWVIAWSSMVETVRRKDLYVVWILAVFGLAAGNVLGAMGVRGIETFLRDITLTVVNLLSTIICIWLAARQIPEELSRKTLFPLLARPVRRFDVLLGKFLTVWILSSGALLVLAIIAEINLTLFKASIGPIFWQYVLLRILSFGPIAAMTMLLSLVMSGPAALTIAALFTLFATTFARTLFDVIQAAPAAAQLPLKLVYFLIPHLDLFDLSQRAAYDYPPLEPWALGALALYGALYALAFLGLGNLRFRHTAL
jgi:ABC-type transport system involved in multi-copper enzyme maturation permease subunit